MVETGRLIKREIAELQFPVVLTGAMTRERLANLPEDDFRKRNPFFQEPMVSWKEFAQAFRLQ